MVLERAVLPWQKPAVLYHPPCRLLSMAAATCAALGMAVERGWRLCKVIGISSPVALWDCFRVYPRRRANLTDKLDHETCIAG